ncbi:MAG: hypothetical protein EOO28_29250 [Comamonadaceae bacterium]|nr:MAG: hypothetical protein EOO28_29250 [Comamonadaceae bacterium]
MRDKFRQFAIPGAAIIMALALFGLGLSYPLELRVRGDAYLYLLMANTFDGLGAALTHIADRTAGMPLFDYLVRRALGLFIATDQLQPWVDVICFALLAIHLVTCWYFARWMGHAGCLASDGARQALFFLLASFPALIGYTTTPLSDTFAIDLILAGCVLQARALRQEDMPRALLGGLAAGLLLGLSVLVRSGSMAGVVAGLFAACVLSVHMGRFRQAAMAATVAACLLVFAPYFTACMRAHGTLCLQHPAFDPLPSAQAGLRGARTLWFKPPVAGEIIPTLEDPQLMASYGVRCQLTGMGGISNSSLTGCLLSRPMTIPAWLFKKWVGLMDHFRFHAYLEGDTPPWLKWLSRAYDGLVWMGFALAFPAAAITVRTFNRFGKEQWATVNPALVTLAVYAACMLAIHTALHVEDRYGFPWLAVCLVILVASAEKAVAAVRAGRWRTIALPLAYSVTALVAFLAQVVSWDQMALALTGKA